MIAQPDGVNEMTKLELCVQLLQQLGSADAKAAKQLSSMNKQLITLILKKVKNGN